jgi:putative two-component system response regulator
MLVPTILVVDDEPGNLAVMRDILASSYKLVFARNGVETLAAVQKHMPAMVLLDVGLPDTNGYDLCRRIKQSDPTHAVQVIFVTGYTDVAHEAAGFDAGGVDYIVKPVSPPIVRARVAAHLSLVRTAALEKSYREAVLMLGQAGHYNDTDTGSHIWRMAAYARALAQAVGWDTESSMQLELAAPMHDTGKLGIPHAILRKPGPLSDEEWVIMKTHPQIGYDILSKSDAPVFQLAAEVALRHHEKWDGSGYPDGLRGHDIPQSARIVAMADVFDALCMRRPYKDAWSVEQIVDYIHADAESHFDPEIMEAFKRIMPELLDIRTHWMQAETA